MERGIVEEFNDVMGFGTLRNEAGNLMNFTKHMVPEVDLASVRKGVAVLFTHQDQSVTDVQLVKDGSSQTSGVPLAKNSVQPYSVSNLPYDFVPIPQDSEQEQVKGLSDAPVFHDGKDSYLSGELRCTLMALTPLLAANAQYEAQELEGIVAPASETASFRHLPKAWGWQVPVHPKKKLLEPLRLRDGRVGISGTALKGMLRQSLSALLAAPMERVEEKAYSYRPNLSIQTRNPKLETRPAVVLDNAGNTLTVQVLPNADAVVFVRTDALNKIKSTLKLPPKPGQPLSGIVPGLQLITSAGRSRLQTDRRAAATGFSLTGYYYYNYTGGIDGSGLLQQAFRLGGGAYQHVLVSQKALQGSKSEAYKIEDHVVKHYQLTQQYLSDDISGHLRNEHPLSAQAPFKQAKAALKASVGKLPVKGQLIYIEFDPKAKRIVSFGHHFRYRWRYADTIRTRWQSDGEGRVRASVKPLAEELKARGTGDHQPPERLSGARLLFGYVADSEGTQGIGHGDYKRLAGRIACNMALEQTPDGLDESRFLNSERGCVVPLKILGTPRPSAVEHYVEQAELSERQDGGSLITYGDLPGVDPLAEPSGDLKGRKFYVHQPDARTDRTRYEASEADLERLDQNAASKTELVKALHNKGLRQIKASDTALTIARQIIEHKKLEDLHKLAGERDSSLPRAAKLFVEDLERFHGEQSMLARFVSPPSTEFRFTIRFRDLRPWELGALWCALTPQRITTLPGEHAPELKDYLANLPNSSSEDSPQFALKLGHGRPLGLGSVRVSVDQAYLWTDQSQEPQLVPIVPGQEQDIFGAFSNQIEQLDGHTVKQWLEVHRYHGQRHAEYPHRDGKIYEHHTQERRKHAMGRRSHSAP